MSLSYQRKIIEVEKRLGFMYIPAIGQELMPKENATVVVHLSGQKNPSSLQYNSEHNRIFGLTGWYKKNSIEVGSLINVNILPDYTIHLSVVNTHIQQAETEEKEGEELINISGLSSIEKGNIVEDRIKELILLHGQGLLNVYRPVIDKEGIDLVITKSGTYKPIFIQVKSRFTAVAKEQLLFDVKMQPPHYSYFILGAAFNPATLELEDNLLLIPSHDFFNTGTTINNKKRKTTLKRATASLKSGSKDVWQQYFIKKKELVNTLLEKIEEMSKYIK